MPDLLKVEKINFEGNDPARPRHDLWAYCVASKKYVLVVPRPDGTADIVRAAAGESTDADDTDEPENVDRRDHGLGYLRNPIDPRVVAQFEMGHPNVPKGPNWAELARASRNWMPSSGASGRSR